MTSRTAMKAQEDEHQYTDGITGLCKSRESDKNLQGLHIYHSTFIYYMIHINNRNYYSEITTSFYILNASYSMICAYTLRCNMFTYV